MEKKEAKTKIFLVITKAINEDHTLDPFLMTAEILVDRFLEYATPLEISDVLAFIDWCEAHDKSVTFASANVCHDMNGIVNLEPCFVPRTAGYSDPAPPYCKCG
jgi:hypothetical protein